MNNIKNSIILKIISYISIPIIVVILILSIVYTVYTNEDNDFLTAESYFETESFKDVYYSNIMSNIQELFGEISVSKSIRNLFGVSSNAFQQFSNDSETINYYYNYYDSNFNYLIIDNKTGIAYTNLDCNSKTDTIEEIREIVINNNHYWNYSKENNSIDTTIDDLSRG